MSKDRKGYDSTRVLSSFVGMFPMSEPQYLVLVLLDEPKPNKEYIYTLSTGQKYKGNWRNTAGWTTVLISGLIIKSIGPILDTKY